MTQDPNSRPQRQSRLEQAGAPHRLRQRAAVLSAAEVRAADAAAQAAGISIEVLMQRAGAAVAAATLAEWPGLRLGKDQVLVLCGGGMNGGDGYVAAEALRAAGVQVSVCALHPPTGATIEAAKRWGGPLRPIAEEMLEEADLIIDALYGTGLNRALDDTTARLARRAHLLGIPVVSIDVPSGLCADSGRVRGEAFHATLTVSFGSPRRGHLLAEGPARCGRLILADIGTQHPETGSMPVFQAQPAALERPIGKLGFQRHKYSYGHALVLAGGPGCGGAARLAARAALRVGAGAVTVAAPAAALADYVAQANAIMLQFLDHDSFWQLIEDARVNALVLGPALTKGAEADSFWPLFEGLAASSVWSRGERVMVWDADALTLGATDKRRFFEILAQGPSVLTPHMGEFVTLFPDLGAPLLLPPPAQGPIPCKISAAQQAARRANAVVVLKGGDTVIASPNGQVALHAAAYDRACPWLATAGAGDVLAGIIAGLAAQGHAAFEAAFGGVWLHAEAARRFGPGLIADDLPEQLPAVLAALSA